MLVSLDVSSQLNGRMIQVEGIDVDVKLPSRLVLGNQACIVQAVRGRQSKETARIRLSKAVANAYGLPEHSSLHLKVQQNWWRLGPVLGFYADNVNSEDRPYGEQTRMFEELTAYGTDLGVYVIVLSPLEPFKARYNQESNKWDTSHMEPDVVIRRSGGFSNGAAKKAREDLSMYQRLGKLHTLPRSMSNKWNLYQVLETDKNIARHLPRTTLCTSGYQLYGEVLQRRDVYLKPTGGAQGVSIYHFQRMRQLTSVEWEKRILPRRTERLTNTFEPRTRTKRLVLRSPQEFQKFWKSTRMARAIVQDTVILPIHDNLRCDFRWLVHSSDEPIIIARVARLGARNSITTNIHTGGMARSAEAVLAGIIGAKKHEELLQRMDETAIQLVRTLAGKFGPFAELGIDMAVTNDGQIYIFEINPTPGRRMLRHLSTGIRRLSLDSLLEYAVKATTYGN